MSTDDNQSTSTTSDDDTLNPTDLQHMMAKALGTCMRAALRTARDKQIVVALLASAAGVDNDWGAFMHMVESSPQRRAGYEQAR